MFIGKTALLTGSACASAAGYCPVAGRPSADVNLDSFGEVPPIERLRCKLAGQHDVRERYDGTGMSTPRPSRPW